MRVSNNSNKDAEVQLSRTSKNGKAQGAKGKEASASDDAGTGISVGDSAAVNISGEAKAMSKAKEIAKSDDIDQAKVDRVKAMINKGSYKPDFGKVADKMVNETLMQELG